jgi:hypothetical protein
MFVAVSKHQVQSNRIHPLWATIQAPQNMVEMAFIPLWAMIARASAIEHGVGWVLGQAFIRIQKIFRKNLKYYLKDQFTIESTDAIA